MHEVIFPRRPVLPSSLPFILLTLTPDKTEHSVTPLTANFSHVSGFSGELRL